MGLYIIIIGVMELWITGDLFAYTWVELPSQPANLKPPIRVGQWVKWLVMEVVEKDTISLSRNNLWSLRWSKDGTIKIDVRSLIWGETITVDVEYKINLPVNRFADDEVYFEDSSITFLIWKKVWENIWEEYLGYIENNTSKIIWFIRQAFYGD
jgi:hypothetical protein